MADLTAKIIKQVEYYFSDNNLPRDDFLLGVVKASEEGWVPLTTLVSFQRLKALSTDTKVIADALRASSNNLLEVNAEGTEVRRVVPLPDEVDTIKCSAYLKGFPQEYTLDQIEAFLAENNITNVKAIRMRRVPSSKTFKGSVFLEFATPEEAEAFAANKLKLNEVEMVALTKAAYLDQKMQERNAQKKAKAEGASSSSTSAPKEIPKGCILRIEGIGAGASREDLTSICGQFGEIAYVDFQRDLSDGFVRFADPESAKKALATLTEAKTEFKGAVPTLRLLEGEEEELYIAKSIEAMKEKYQQKNRNKGGKGGRGGKGFKGKHNNNRGVKRSAEDDAEGDAKASKVDNDE